MMHRTQSVDYGIVTNGEVIAKLSVCSHYAPSDQDVNSLILLSPQPPVPYLTPHDDLLPVLNIDIFGLSHSDSGEERLMHAGDVCIQYVNLPRAIY